MRDVRRTVVGRPVTAVKRCSLLARSAKCRSTPPLSVIGLTINEFRSASTPISRDPGVTHTHGKGGSMLIFSTLNLMDSTLPPKPRESHLPTTFTLTWADDCALKSGGPRFVEDQDVLPGPVG